MLLVHILGSVYPNSIDFRRTKEASRNHHVEATPFHASPYVCLMNARGHLAAAFCSAVFVSIQRPS